ncbi:GM22433 [Drosophila sechellia]|uniref:GD15021 n=2 Tax=melanogaster subgroup TaxID=32351 RepID=B4QKR2_DROSI|nr:GM22433 [Drosophila sechellia]EDX11477.1 GD15021 [Drosophila simulans]
MPATAVGSQFSWWSSRCCCRSTTHFHTSSTPPPHHNLLPLQGFVTFKMLGLLRGGVAEEKKFK